jgi:hypothetical protein
MTEAERMARTATAIGIAQAWASGREEMRQEAVQVCLDDAHTNTPDERRGFVDGGGIRYCAWQAQRSAKRIRALSLGSKVEIIAPPADAVLGDTAIRHVGMISAHSGPCGDACISLWVEWTGGWCPIPAGISCEIRLRSGLCYRPQQAEQWAWGRFGNDSDIVAYRLLPEKEEDAP